MPDGDAPQKDGVAGTGAPLTGDPSWEAQRAGARQRTEGGFVTSPVLGKLDSAAGKGLDIVAAGEDRHVYAWHADGSAVSGYPVLVEDPSLAPGRGLNGSRAAPAC